MDFNVLAGQTPEPKSGVWVKVAGTTDVRVVDFDIRFNSLLGLTFKIWLATFLVGLILSPFVFILLGIINAILGE